LASPATPASPSRSSRGGDALPVCSPALPAGTPAVRFEPRRRGTQADTTTIITGNLTEDPEVHFTPNGAAVANLRVAVTARVKDGNDWKDGDTSFFRVNVWRSLAEHVGDSLSKGDRVIIVGRLKTRSWETPEGERRTVTEIDAEEIGPSLRWATAKPERTTAAATAAAGSASKPKPSGQFNDEPPF
jgi:single-strand DNA-binding protein